MCVYVYVYTYIYIYTEPLLKVRGKEICSPEGDRLCGAMKRPGANTTGRDT